MAPAVSIIIRCKNEVQDIATVLCAIFSQKLDQPFEVIAVDSGSTDGTLDILRRFPVRVIEIPPASFSFGRALNVGCREARGEVFLALSAHVYPRTSRWLANHLRHFDNPRVAATCTGRATLIYQDAQAFEADPYAGYDNANGAFRASLWRERPFDENMTGTEDKEWSYHFQRQGYLVVCDPEADALHEHPVAGTGHLMRDRYRRAYREHIGFRQFLGRKILFQALAHRIGRRGFPKNRETLSWYLGACAGILRAQR